MDSDLLFHMPLDVTEESFAGSCHELAVYQNSS